MSDWPRSMEVRSLTSWPGALSTKRRDSPFKSGLTSTLQLLDVELRNLGVRGTPVLEVAIPQEQFRLDGRPRAQAQAEHPGVVLSVVGRPGAMSYPCDSFKSWQDNLRAIALSLEALRKVDRYGVTASGEQYRGFLAIESTSSTPVDDEIWLRTLVGADGTWLLDEVIRRAKRLAHPDMGGDVATFQRVVDAEKRLREDAR